MQIICHFAEGIWKFVDFGYGWVGGPETNLLHIPRDSIPSHATLSEGISEQNLTINPRKERKPGVEVPVVRFPKYAVRELSLDLCSALSEELGGLRTVHLAAEG